MRKKILVVADAACPSGFAKSTHNLLEALHPTFDVTVLGLNYLGDPHPYPYPIYSCLTTGSAYDLGIARLIWACDTVRQSVQRGPDRVMVPQDEWRNPDVIVIQNDPWNIPLYLNRLRLFPEYANVPVVGIVAVDGKNCPGKGMNGLALAVFWTQFALDEARAGGYTGPAVVIPLGVDLGTYYPTDKYEARLRRGLPKELDDAFIVGNVNRNQPRKRWDLTIKYFAEWVHHGPLKDAYLYLHTAPTGDTGIQVLPLAAYYGILQRVILMEPATFYGNTEEELRDTYNCFDVQVTTTQGEGFGLTTFEGMACGVPQIVPGWSALGELCKEAARIVPCTSTAIGPPYLNVIGGVADERTFVAEIDALYKNKELRRQTSEAGLARAREDRFRWSTVGEAFKQVVNHVVRCAEDDRAVRDAEARAAREEAEWVAWGLGGGVRQEEPVA